MTGSTIDHMFSVIVFLGAMLLFIGLFNQTIQTAIIYQQHRHISTKCSDLLDNISLNPGHPAYWGRSNCTPTSFGLQDPEFTHYKLSPFSLMRLQSSTGESVNYSKTGLTYSNITMGFGQFLFVPYTEAVNYSTAATLLGVNNTYGFQLTITPIIAISIAETNPGNPLTLIVSVTGKGFPLSNSALSYCLIEVVEKGGGKHPSYTSSFDTVQTDSKGSAVLSFQDVETEESYVLIAFAHMSGLIGIGYHSRVTSDKRYVIPLIDSFGDRRILLAHSYDVHYFGPPESAVFYNATFVLLTEDFTLREMNWTCSGKVSKVTYGGGHPYEDITIPTYNPGILIITYESNNDYGIILMPWGIGAMAFPVAFGGDPFGREWVATDTRQVIVGKIAYQAQLALWSLKGYGVMG